MPESFVEKRRRELGLTTSSPSSDTSNTSSSSFAEKRKRELGLIAKIEQATTRPVRPTQMGTSSPNVESLQQEVIKPPAVIQPRRTTINEPVEMDDNAGVLRSSKTPFKSAISRGTNNALQGIKEGFGLVPLINFVENLPGIKQLGGALAGGYNAVADNPSVPLSQWGSQSQKNIGSLFTDTNGLNSFNKGVQGMASGAMNPEEARAKQSEIIAGRTQGMNPVGKFGYEMLSQVSSDPLSLLPFGGVSRASKLASESGNLLKAPLKGAVDNPVSQGYTKNVGRTFGNKSIVRPLDTTTPSALSDIPVNRTVPEEEIATAKLTQAKDAETDYFFKMNKKYGDDVNSWNFEQRVTPEEAATWRKLLDNREQARINLNSSWENRVKSETAVLEETPLPRNPQALEGTSNELSQVPETNTLSRPIQALEEPNVREYGTLTSLKESPKVHQETLDNVAQKGDTEYEIKPNQATVDNANTELSTLGNEKAKAKLLNKVDKSNNSILNSDDLALGYRLIDEFQATGDYDSAADVALKLMRSNLEGGRSIQINSIYNRLTPEGALRVATKEYNKHAPTSAEEKALPANVAETMLNSAKKLQASIGETKISKDAMQVMEKAKSGEKLTSDESSTLKKFFDEARKYVGEEKPRARKRDGIAKFSSQQADAARKRIAMSRNLNFAAQSSNPLIDYAIIGTDHMVQGAVKFADFAERMVKEFGNDLDMDALYNKSWDRYKRLNKLKSSEFETMVSRALTGSKMSDGEKIAMRRMAIELSQLGGTAQKEAMAELQKAFNSISEASTGKKAASLLRSAQLGNARTLIRNEFSNHLFYALDTVRRKFAIIPDILTPGERTVFVKNNLNSWNQYFKDWKEGYKYSRQGINPKGLESQYDLGSNAFNSTSTKVTDRVGSFLERNIGAVMKASDYAAANRAISTELYQLAQAKAYKEGLRGKAFKQKAEHYFHTADDKMQDEAMKYGEYMTFQDNNFASKAAVALRDKVLNVGKDFGLGNIVFNYPKTPTNILMRAVDYSPAGYVRFMTQMGKAAFKKNVSKREMIDSFTRATSGSGMVGMGMYLASIGVLNVLPSKDSAMNSLERSAGKIPNSLNVSGLIRYVTSFGDRESAKPRKWDNYASVDWLQPMAIPMSVGASLAQAQSSSRLKTGANAADAAVQSLDAAAESAGNMSVYRTFKDLFGSQYQGAGEKTGRLLSNTATAFIPSLSGQLRNSIDPNTRDTKDKNVLKQVGKSVLNKTPFASKLLNKRYDNLGNEMKSDFGPVGRTINSFINPSILDKYNPSEGAQIVLDLIDRTGQTRLAPNAPSKSFTYKKDTYSYTPDEYRELQQKVGQLVQEGLDKHAADLKGEESDEKKMYYLDTIMSEALERAKYDYLEKKGIR